ncbi:hypothetical protein [Candidatus Magnetobacterium casense]|nr:hypothetical protein [Candidatus Magnetobacterium casensis]
MPTGLSYTCLLPGGSTINRGCQDLSHFYTFIYGVVAMLEQHDHV